MRLLDAHNHLHDARLDTVRGPVLRELHRIGLERAVVNGTREADWDAVARLAAECAWVTPSFGLHPWHVAGRTESWVSKLEELLDADGQAGVGEIGLDRWVAGHDVNAQTEVLKVQLELAAKRNRPVTLHCLKAWGVLWEAIRFQPLPDCGFLLHSYGGPSEMVKGFVERGAYFSFSAYLLHERKATQREVFRSIPEDRLLVETDAPDMSPPPERNSRPLADAEGTAINHPANLEVAYAGLAEVRGIRIEELAAMVAENFRRLFGA